jgi:hypothetical protein
MKYNVTLTATQIDEPVSFSGICIDELCHHLKNVDSEAHKLGDESLRLIKENLVIEISISKDNSND